MADLLKVKYVGPKMAILAGRAIYSGETRGGISPAQLANARRTHPEGFEVVGSEAEAAAEAEAVDLAAAVAELVDEEGEAVEVPEGDLEDDLEQPAEIATGPAAALAEEHGLDLSTVEGTGADGRILVSDVEKTLAAQEAED